MTKHLCDVCGDPAAPLFQGPVETTILVGQGRRADPAIFTASIVWRFVQYPLPPGVTTARPDLCVPCQQTIVRRLHESLDRTAAGALEHHLAVPVDFE